MGADIKKLRNRIRSVDSTLHLTKAMGLVASSKIRRASESMLRARQYGLAVEGAIAPLMLCSDGKQSKYMKPVSGEGKTCLVVIAGDRGMAGGYNANVFRTLKAYPDADVIPVGKRANDRYGKGAAPIFAEDFTYANAREIAATLCKGFTEGKYSKVGILYTRYISMMTQEANVTDVLPLVAPEEEKTVDVVFEPGALEILDSAVPEYVAGKIFAAVRESFASEVAARRCAMDSAGKNAQEMIDSLQLKYNRARQGAITQEITEIVAGSNS